jgi:hypothetical protein
LTNHELTHGDLAELWRELAEEAARQTNASPKRRGVMISLRQFRKSK